MQYTSDLISFNKKVPESHCKAYDGVIKTVCRIPNPYVGNKKALLGFMGNVINKYSLKFDTFLDAFSGSSVVSLFMKGLGKRVLSNDILTSSYLHSVALVENNSVKLSDEHIEYILSHNNPNVGTFVQDNWMAKAGSDCLSQRFSENEAKQLDRIRANIKDITNCFSQSIGLSASNLLCMRLPFGFIDKSIDIYNHRKKQIKKYGKDSQNHDRRIGIYYDQETLDLNFKKWFPKYVKSLQENIDSNEFVNPRINHAVVFHGMQNFLYRNCFLKGRFNSGQILANVKARIKDDGEMDFDKDKIQKLTFTHLSGLSDKRCISTNCDIIDLLESNFVDVDCVYFDPPYGGSSSDYANLYRFFEEFIFEEKMENLPYYENGSLFRFSNKKVYEENFVKMLSAAENIPTWIISYNDSSWNGLESIKNVIGSFRKTIFVESRPHFYNYRKDRKKPENEHLIVALK